MKHSKFISRTLLTSCYVLASLGFSKHGLEAKQSNREEQSAKDTEILYSRVHLPDKPLKLKDIVNVAFKRNLNLLAYEQEYLMERDIAIRSQLDKFPQANVTGEMQHRFNRAGSLSSSDGVTSNSFSSSTPRNTRKADIQYLFNLLDFGVTHYRFRQAKNRFHILAQKHKRLKQSLLLDLTTAYWQAVIAQKATEGAQIILALTEKRQRDIQKQVKHKLVSEIEGLENQRRLLETQLRLKSYKKELDNSKAQLLQLMGLPPSTEFELAYEEVKVRQPDEIDVKKLEELSLLHRPELFTSDLEEKVDADEVRASILSMFPNIQVIGGHFFDENPLLENNYWNTVGSRALFNILSIPTNEKTFHIARHKKHLTQANRLNTSIGVISQVHLAHLEFKDAWEQHKLAKSLFETKERLLEVGRLEQKQGVFDAADILELESESLFAEIFSNTTHAELHIALARMGNAIGDPLAFVEVNMDDLELAYADMVNFDVPKRMAEQWAYAKSSYTEESEYDDTFLEIAISQEEQNRRKELLTSAQNREYFESTLSSMNAEQLKQSIQYTTLFTKDDKATDRVSKLATNQLLALKKESLKTFNDIVPHFEAMQIKELMQADKTVFGPTDISQFQARQLIELQKIDSKALDQFMPQITPLQLAALMQNENFIHLPGAIEKVKKLSHDQLELVYSVDAKLFRKVVGVLSGEQLKGLIGRQSHTRGLVTKWSQDNLPGIIDSDASLVNLLESHQLEYLAVNAPEKFERIDHQLSVDQIRALIRETSLFDTASTTSPMMAKMPEHLLLDMFSKDAVAFEKVIPLLSAQQLNFFIAQGNIFNDNERASERTSKLIASQIVNLKQSHSSSFQRITQNFSGQQLLEIFAKGDQEKRTELIQVLSQKQILEIHQSDRKLFGEILAYFDKNQLVDLIYNTPNFTQDPHAPQHIQSLSSRQLEGLKDASYVAFSSLLPHMTEFQVLDLIKSEPMVMAHALTSQQSSERLAHFLSPSQLQALYYLDQDSFKNVMASLNATQLDSLVHLNPKLFTPELVNLVAVERLIELYELKNSHLSAIIPHANIKQVASLLASLPLEKQDWVEKIPNSIIEGLYDQEAILVKALPYFNGTQLSTLMKVDNNWVSYKTQKGVVVQALKPQVLAQLDNENSDQLTFLLEQLSTKQLLALIQDTTVFDTHDKNRFEKVSFSTIFEIFHADTASFKKILPQLAIHQVKNLFEDKTYIDEYVGLFSSQQLYALMQQYPKEVKKVVSKLSVQQLAALLNDPQLSPTPDFVAQLPIGKIEKLVSLSPQAFINLSAYLQAEKIQQITAANTIFVKEEVELSLGQKLNMEALQVLEQQSPESIDVLMPHLSYEQVISLADGKTKVFGELNTLDREAKNERVEKLHLKQLKTMASTENFKRFLPFLSAIQIQNLHYSDASLFKNPKLVQGLLPDQLLALTQSDLSVLTSFADLLSIKQVHNTLVHAPEKSTKVWVSSLSPQQIKGIYQRDKTTFHNILPTFSAQHLDALIGQESKGGKWFKKAKESPRGLLDHNESLLQRLSSQQLQDLENINPQKVDSILPYLSNAQTKELLDTTSLMTKENGKRAKNLTLNYLADLYEDSQEIFDKVFSALSIQQIHSLFVKKPVSTSYINKMSYPQLSTYYKAYSQDFYKLIPQMDVEQLSLLLETQELNPESLWVSSLSLSQLKDLGKKDKLGALMTFLSPYQFEDLVLNTSLLTQDQEAKLRVTELQASQLIQLNQKNPGAIDLVLPHLSLKQMQQLTSKDPDFLTDNRIKALNPQQLQVINMKEVADSEELIAHLSNDQLVALIQKDQFFKVNKEENKERIQALQHGHLSHISKYQPQFLERVIKDLEFNQLKHLILTTSFLTHDNQALQRMTLLATEQIVDLYRKLNFFKEGKRAQSLLHQLSQDQLLDLAQKDSDTFDAFFSSLSTPQLITLINNPQKVVREKHIQSLAPSTLMALAEQKIAPMAYPPKSYMDMVIKFISADQLQHLFQYSSLLTEKYGDDLRLHYLSIKQLKAYYEQSPSNFKEVVSKLSQKQLSILVGQTKLFTESQQSKELVEALSDEQLKKLKDSHKNLVHFLLRHLSLSQLDKLYPFSQNNAKAGAWVSYLSLPQVKNIGKVAPQFISQVIPYLTSGQVLQLMESTELFQNPNFSRRYIQSMTFDQVKEIAQGHESYFQQIIGQLSNEQVSQLMGMQIKTPQASKGFLARLFSSSSKKAATPSDTVINASPMRLQYLTLNQLDHVFSNDPKTFWQLLPDLNTYQLSEVIDKSLLFKEQRAASDFAKALSQQQILELLEDEPSAFKSLIVYLNGEQLSSLINTTQLFSHSSRSKEMVEKLMLVQIEEVYRASTKSFATLLRYLSTEQLAEVIDKTSILTEDSQATLYLQYLSSHQVLKLRDQQSESFSKLIKVMDTRQIVSLIDMNNTPLTPQYLQVLSLNQLESLSIGQPISFEKIFSQLSSSQLNSFLLYSEVFESLKDKKKLIQQLNSGQLNQLGLNSPKAFKIVLPHLSGAQIATMIYVTQQEKKSFIGKVLDQVTERKMRGLIGAELSLIQALSAQQLIELHQVNAQKFETIASGFSEEQIAKIIETSTVYQGEEGIRKIQQLYSHQIIKVASSHPYSLVKVLSAMSGNQIDALNRETLILSNHKNAAIFVNVLEVGQLRELSNQYPQTFDSLLKNIGKEVVDRLIQDPETDFTPHFVNSLSYQQLNKMHHYNAKNFIKAFHYFNITQIADFIQHSDLLTKDPKAKEKVALLTLGQLQELNAINPQLFDAIISNLNSEQLTGIVKSNTRLMTQDRVKQLSESQISGLSVLPNEFKKLSQAGS